MLKFIFCFTLFVTSLARAEFMCTDIFTVQEKPTLTILPHDLDVLREFELNRQILLASQNIEQVNAELIPFVQSANLMLDQIARNLITIKSNQLSLETRSLFSQSSLILIDVIEKTLGLSRPVLESALVLRMDEYIKNLEEQKTKMSLRVPMGFRISHRAIEKEVDEFVDKWTIGFLSKPVSQDAPQTHPKKESTEEVASESKEKWPIGFIHWKNDSDSIQEKQPMGFVDLSQFSQRQEQDIYTLSFNISTGDFEVVRPKYKLGF